MYIISLYISTCTTFTPQIKGKPVHIYVVVVTWERVICLKYTHEHEGAARVRVCIYFVVALGNSVYSWDTVFHWCLHQDSTVSGLSDCGIPFVCLILFSCPALAICAGGGRNGQSIKKKKYIYFRQITSAHVTTNIFHLGESPASVHGNCSNAL